MTGEAEHSVCNNQPEPLGGASEQSHNGTRPKRYTSLMVPSYKAGLKYVNKTFKMHVFMLFFCLFVFISPRMAPVPKYLKMHYVKEEISDGKGE